MIVKPKRWGHDNTYKPTMPGDYLGIECEVLNPPSARGRTVYVFLDDEDVVWLMKECKDRAIVRRSKSMADKSDP